MVFIRKLTTKRLYEAAVMEKELYPPEIQNGFVEMLCMTLAMFCRHYGLFVSDKDQEKLVGYMLTYQYWFGCYHLAHLVILPNYRYYTHELLKKFFTPIKKGNYISFTCREPTSYPLVKHAGLYGCRVDKIIAAPSSIPEEKMYDVFLIKEV